MPKRQDCRVTIIVTFGLWALTIPKGWSLRGLRDLRDLRDCIFCLQGRLE